jgi:hypothetical protein
MLEEIKQLKEHIRKRDKVIDELLINKQGHHGNEEPTMVVLLFSVHLLYASLL